jgi:hypothetical protein
MYCLFIVLKERLFIFISTIYVIKFSIYLCSKFFFFFLSFRATFCFTNPEYPLIQMIYPQFLWIGEGLL